MSDKANLGERPAFEVRMPDGHTYRIYQHGEIEGFGEGAWINNGIPLLISNARLDSLRRFVADPEAAVAQLERHDRLAAEDGGPAMPLAPIDKALAEG